MVKNRKSWKRPKQLWHKEWERNSQLWHDITLGWHYPFFCYFFLRQTFPFILFRVFVSLGLFFCFYSCFMLKSPGWWKALISFLLHSSFIYKHTHARTQAHTHTNTSVNRATINSTTLSLHPMCAREPNLAHVTSILSLIYPLCIVLISRSLPRPSLTSSHPSPLIIIFCPEVEFLHHRFCHLHPSSLLFSLSILPPCLLFTHFEATQSLTGTQYINIYIQYSV